MSDLVPYRRHGTRQLFLGGAIGDAADWVGDQVKSAAQNEWVQTIGATAIGGPLAGAIANDTSREWMKENPQTVGTVLGGAAGAVLGNPMLGAKLGRTAGGMAGKNIEGLGSDPRENARRMMRGRRRSAAPSYGGSGGSYTRAKGGAMRVSGRSHEQGGIRLPGNVEMEGGETVGSARGGAHAFSKRLQVPGTDMTFADMHQQLVQRGAGQDRINQLANLQAQVAGRGDTAGQRQDGGPVDDSTRFDQPYPEEAQGRGIPDNPLSSDRVGMTGLKRIPGSDISEIFYDFANEVQEEVSDMPSDVRKGVDVIRSFFEDEKRTGGKLYATNEEMDHLEDGGEYHAIKASETSGDDPKYPINSADDVRDAWKLRSHGDYNISQEKLEQRIKRKAREYDVDLPTGDGDSKAYGGSLQFLSGINVDRDQLQDGGNILSVIQSMAEGARNRRPDVNLPNMPFQPGGEFNREGADVGEYNPGPLTPTRPLYYVENPGIDMPGQSSGGSGGLEGRSGNPNVSGMPSRRVPQTSADNQVMSPNVGRFPSTVEALMSGSGEGIAGGSGSSSPSLPGGDVPDAQQVEGAPAGNASQTSLSDFLPSLGGGNTGGGGGNASAPASGTSIPTASGSGDSGGIGSTLDDALPYLPGVANLLRGALSDAEGVELPQMNIPDTAINRARNIETDIDVQPQVAAANEAFRSIAADPNATQQQKQAAFSNLLKQRSQIEATEENKETSLENQRQKMIARLTGQQERAEAQANQQAATREALSEQKAEAARQNLISSGITQLGRARQRQQARQAGMNRNIMAVLASMGGAPRGVREDVLSSILPLIQNERTRNALANSIGQ